MRSWWQIFYIPNKSCTWSAQGKVADFVYSKQIMYCTVYTLNISHKALSPTTWDSWFRRCNEIDVLYYCLIFEQYRTFDFDFDSPLWQTRSAIVNCGRASVPSVWLDGIVANAARDGRAAGHTHAPNDRTPTCVLRRSRRLAAARRHRRELLTAHRHRQHILHLLAEILINRETVWFIQQQSEEVVLSWIDFIWFRTAIGKKCCSQGN